MAARQKFVRNILEVPVGFRFQKSGSRLDLAARGQRGDTRPVDKEDLEDSVYAANHGVLFEEITAAEAKAVIEKQSTNISENRTHPAWDSIRTEQGEEYENQEVRLESEEDQGAVVVAKTKRQAEGVGEVVIDRGVGIRRAGLPGTEGHDLPNVPDHVAPEDQAEYLARERANREALDGLTVTTGDPVEVTDDTPTQ